MGVLKRSARNVARKKSRIGLVVLAISLAMAIMISVPSGIMSNAASVQRLNDNYADMMTRTQAEINQTANLIECRYSFRDSGYLNDSDVQFIAALQNVSNVVPMLSERYSDSSTSTFYSLTGLPLQTGIMDKHDILPTNLTKGRNLVPGDYGVVVIDTNLAKALSVDIESYITINGTQFKVVGIYSPGSFQSQRPMGGSFGRPQGGTGSPPTGQPPGGGFPSGQMQMQGGFVYLSLYDLQKLYGVQGQVNQLDVYANDVSQVDTIASSIEANYTSLTVSTPKDRLERLQSMSQMFQTTLSNSQSTLASMQSLAYQEIGLALVATVAIVFFTMIYAVRERTREIGIMKAIGFSNGDVMKQFILEGLMICVLAGVVGIIIGYIGAPFLSSALLPQNSQSAGPGGSGGGGFTRGAQVFIENSAQVSPDPWITAAAFGVSVLVGVAGSIYPAWKASRTSPMEALRYE